MRPGTQQPPSTTSLISALGRGLHRLRHDPPWVLDDPFALSLVGPSWPDLYANVSAAFRDVVQDEAIGFVTARSRYVEDLLLAGGHEQYIVLGAGMDSFAWRRPDVLDRVRVIEFDHPATQAWKLQRAEELALPTSSEHVFVAVDFETETLRDALDGAGFDWTRPALFSWLGVVPYLTVDAVEATLRTIASCAPGTAIVLTYWPVRDDLDDNGREFHDLFTAVAGDSGEPIQLPLAPAEMEAMLGRCGLTVEQHPTAADLHARYFAGRRDGLRPYTAERLVSAAVPEES